MLFFTYATSRVKIATQQIFMYTSKLFGVGASGLTDIDSGKNYGLE
jgi:hypothetical protein